MALGLVGLAQAVPMFAMSLPAGYLADRFNRRNLLIGSLLALVAYPPLIEPGKVTQVEDVKVIGHLNVPGRIAASASGLYAKNLVTFLETMVSKEEKRLAVNMEDELVKATALTHGGAVVHPAFGGTNEGEK